MEIQVVLEKEEGGHSVYVSSLPGCASQGETKEETIKNIKESIGLYLEADNNEMIIYRDRGESIRIKI